MAENSAIEWTDHTFNPWIGCQKVSPGCDHCYAETWDARGLQQGESRWGPHAARTRTSAANWNKPRQWDRAAAAAGKRARVFCASLADVFDNHASILPEWRRDLWQMIWQTPNLDWLLLTKRPQNVAKMLPQNGLDHPSWHNGWPNVWIGTTVENQTEAERRIPHLLAVPAHVRFLSVEPMLGPVDLRRLTKQIGGHQEWTDALTGETVFSQSGCVVAHRDPIDWVICGGESGPGARPMHPDWARSLRDQCTASRVPFLFKQWGEWAPLGLADDPRWKAVTGKTERAAWHDACGLILDTLAEPDPLDFFCEGTVYRIGKKAAGRMLDGRTWDEVPG